MVLSAEVTRRKLVLGSQDSTTGWYEKTFPEAAQETIDMTLYPNGASFSYQGVGVYAREDAMGLTADPVLVGDEILTAHQRYFEVKTVKEWSLLDSFLFRECQLHELPLHGLSYSDLTPSVNPAQKNTKTYWNTYIDDNQLNNHDWILAYGEPDYPLVRVFIDKRVHIVFAVFPSERSVPLIDCDQTVYGYEEYVPTDVVALDTQLVDLGGMELRRITETYPEGSQRSLNSMVPTPVRLGSHVLYSQRHILRYTRGII